MMRDTKQLALIPALLLVLAAANYSRADPDSSLVGHWRLTGDCRDWSSQGNHGINHDAVLKPDGAALDGIRSYIEVPHAASLALGKGDFSIAVWVHTDSALDDALGDILSKYDPGTRTGVTLSVMNYPGVTCAQSNYRNLAFGIDAGRQDPAWTDCGRPGDAKYILSLAVYDGKLYASTYEEGERQAGHVYRYDGGTTWTDCGSPERCNAVGALAVYQGRLYAGSTRYNAGGSAMATSLNVQPGGAVFRYEGGAQWTNCGKLGQANEVFAMAVFRDKLYATPLRPEGKGLYRYEGGEKWVLCAVPPEDRRVQPLVVYNGSLYGGSYNQGHFFRYDERSGWIDLGQIPDTTQVYSFAVYQGRLYACNWPTGLVLVFDGKRNWTSVGQLGQEREVMGVSVYNGKLYAGTLPLAQVYRYDGPNRWTCTGQLDTTPNVKYRRAWSMAVYSGKLYCGLLPSGHVLSYQAGKSATDDHELPAGWRHVAAVKNGGQLKVFVDGRCAATSDPFHPADYDLSTGVPLRLGFGEHDYFKGKLRDLRLYRRSLTETEIGVLAGRH